MCSTGMETLGPPTTTGTDGRYSSWAGPVVFRPDVTPPNEFFYGRTGQGGMGVTSKKGSGRGYGYGPVHHPIVAPSPVARVRPVKSKRHRDIPEPARTVSAGRVRPDGIRDPRRGHLGLGLVHLRHRRRPSNPTPTSTGSTEVVLNLHVADGRGATATAKSGGTNTRRNAPRAGARSSGANLLIIGHPRNRATGPTPADSHQRPQVRPHPRGRRIRRQSRAEFTATIDWG